jgi:hypothetical protein
MSDGTCARFVEQLWQKMRPHARQWCRRFIVVNTTSQPGLAQERVCAVTHTLCVLSVDISGPVFVCWYTL